MFERIGPATTEVTTSSSIAPMVKNMVEDDVRRAMQEHSKYEPNRHELGDDAELNDPDPCALVRPIWLSAGDEARLNRPRG
jgi:hypothetical protein